MADWRPGDVVVVEERWRGRLWSAVPHVVVESGDRLLTYQPAGTAATYASSIGVPGREHLSRDERKLVALETCVYNVVARSVQPTTLNFFTPGSYGRINLGWHPGGDFIGWYVNFELPPTMTGDGVRTMDLVLDLVVRPDRQWEWKDRDEYDEAVRRGVLEPDLLDTLESEADKVLSQVAASTGPFDDAWLGWRPDPAWPEPELPAGFRVGGDRWSSIEPGGR